MSDQAAKHLAQAFSDVAEAFIADIPRHNRVKSQNEMILEALGNPERGSYYWWAKRCREYTGQHFLDSGAAYGYGFNAPVPPEEKDAITVSFGSDAQIYGASINLPHWLHTMTEAEDETAVEIEEILYWVGTWLMPRESWAAVIDSFKEHWETIVEYMPHQKRPDWVTCSVWYEWTEDYVEAYRLLAGDPKAMPKDPKEFGYEPEWKTGKPSDWPGFTTLLNNGETITMTGYVTVSGFGDLWCHTRLRPGYDNRIRRFQRKRYGEEVIGKAWDGMAKYDLMSWQQSLSREEYIKEALKEMPVEKIKFAIEKELEFGLGGDNTYNQENDLDQVFQFDLVECWGERYAIIQIHTGCDVRGGYTSPVVTRLYDESYFYDWNVDYYCQECGTSWDMGYFYGKALEKNHPRQRYTIEDIQRWRSTIEALEAVEAGQAILPGMPAPHWSEQIDREDAQAILDEIDDDDEWEEESEYVNPTPIAIIEVPGNAQDSSAGTFIVRENGDFPRYAEAAHVRLLCPDCGRLSVGVHNSVYGF